MKYIWAVRDWANADCVRECDGEGGNQFDYYYDYVLLYLGEKDGSCEDERYDPDGSHRPPTVADGAQRPRPDREHDDDEPAHNNQTDIDDDLLTYTYTYWNIQQVDLSR